MQENKPKRKLSDITFEHTGAHVAITHKDQGFSANGKPVALLLKAKTPVEKTQEVQVILQFPEFLKTFFGMNWDDAHLLALLLGWNPAEVPKTNVDEYNSDGSWYDAYFKDKLESFQVIKSLRDVEDISSAFSKLTETEKETLNKDFLTLTKQFKIMELAKDRFQKAAPVSQEPSATASGTEAIPKNTEKTLMSGTKDEISEEIQKQLADKDTKLNEALAKIEQLEAAQKAKIVAEKTAKIKAAISDEASLDVILKAGLSLADEDFDKFVSALEVSKAATEKSLMFGEVGVSGSPEGTEKSSVTKGVKEFLSAQFKKDTK